MDVLEGQAHRSDVGGAVGGRDVLVVHLVAPRDAVLHAAEVGMQPISLLATPGHEQDGIASLGLYSLV